MDLSFIHQIVTPNRNNLFIAANAQPGYLHSFPTRRSSDLFAGRLMCRRHDGYLAGILRFRIIRYNHFAQKALILTFRIYKIRSEEHTSELQSRGLLVCRLLLDNTSMYLKSEEILPADTTHI